MTTIETFVTPTTTKVARAIDDTDEEEEDDPIASINALTINVDHTQEISAPKQQSHIPSSTTMTAHNTSSTSKLSSLRTLLGVPPTLLSSSSSSTANYRLGVGKSNGSGMLGVPPSTSAKTAPAGIGGASGAQIGGVKVRDDDSEGGRETIPSEIAPKRKKVVLGPGCSALDWARVKTTISFRGFRKIKPSELKLHKTKEDAWSAFNGKVYDMTPYLRFHPGGEQELMRVAGRDGTRLFSKSFVMFSFKSFV